MSTPTRVFISRLILPVILLLAAMVFQLDAVRSNVFPNETVHPYLDAALVFFLIFLVIRLLDAFWRGWYARRKKPFPVPKVLHTILLVVLYLAAFFIVLRGILGISITPFLATSALLTAILGLAFQGVLSNLLSGLSLHFTKSFSKGDWVAVGDNEGVILDTNWRETRIFDRFFNVIVVPNNTMASEKITNFSNPSKKTALTIPVKVGYAAPPMQVFAALKEAAADVPEVLDRPAPEAHLLGYEDFGVSYAVKFWIMDFARKFPIMAEVGKNIWYKFKRGQIEIPVAVKDQISEVLGSVQAMQGFPVEEVSKERKVYSLMESSFLRYGEGDRAGELMVAEDDIREFAEIVASHRYAPGEIIFKQGDLGESCYIVTSGRIKGEIRYEEKGKMYTSEFSVEPYNLFGEMSLFTGMPRTATCRVEEEAELLEIKAADFTGLLQRNPRLDESIAELISERNLNNRAFLEKIKELSSQDIAESTNKHSILARLKSLIQRKH